MPHVMNSLDKQVSVKVFGNWIAFTPRQIKYIANENMAFKMNQDLGSEGLVEFPDSAMELDKNSQEFKQIVNAKLKEGRSKRINKLKDVIYNLEVSLQKDLDRANIKSPAYTYASAGELDALKELASYKNLEQDESSLRADEWQKLREKVGDAVKK